MVRHMFEIIHILCVDPKETISATNNSKMIMVIHLERDKNQ